MTPWELSKWSVFILLFVTKSVFSQTPFEHQLMGTSRCEKSDWAGQKKVKAKVVKVVDGDTVRVETSFGMYSIRMLSIDTPETKYYGRSQGVWGERAYQHLQGLLKEGDAVTVELSDEACDRYGRMLGYVWKSRKNMNREMLKASLAVNYCIYPNIKYCKSFGRITKNNIQNKKGIYGDPKLELPYDWRREVMDRLPEKWVGNIYTQEVYPPEDYRQVPVGARIFFIHKKDIPENYQIK
ncbi:MAG: hypothetical protein CL678_13185 [Bdellovibrionaceae bacterium]|nr:hypothetical protein [Pseudobdellovibrionaceae bacterium]|tara:strand:+ start:1451 stop:2167 length:717 start_codon:yes stop_codon:yes gene_type:complete